MENSSTVNNFGDDSLEDFCFPVCDETLKPRVGQTFSSLVEGHEYYKKYAAECGFETRKSTIIRANDGTIRKRWIVCNREGARDKPDPLMVPNDISTDKKRKRQSFRIECMARVIFQITSGGHYMIRTFNEGHTHNMIPQVSRHFMMTNRNVDDVHQMVILSGIKANIGPMRTFRFFKELVGSYEDVGCTSTDFKNYARDLKVYADGSDAHMLLQEFKKKQECCDAFKFYYDVHEENRLRRLFWSDDVSIRNYTLFGEAVSFDATYNTNRYKMIFTPFTGKDNHGKCVSFGAAIISREDMDSYAWVLEKFSECMGSTPTILITDQDPGLRKAVANVWPNTTHRFCMWHITMKVAEKLPVRLRDDSDFKTKFNNIVWSDHDEPTVFEEKWKNLIDEYDLSESRWFNDMYDDRAFWIPAYFRDIRMSGLFRTTFLSESENSFFRMFLNKNFDLLLLYMNYVSAMDAQRHTYHKLTYADETCAPVMVTKLSLEHHAAILYTSAIFKKVQEEIEASMVSCILCGISNEGEDIIYTVDDNIDGNFKVVHDAVADCLACSCKLFIRKGMLCRHMFMVLRTRKSPKISDKYILPRWCKLSMLSPQYANLHLSESSSQRNPPVGNHRFFILLAQTLGYVNGNQDLNDRLFSKLTEVSIEFKHLGMPSQPSTSKQDRFELFYGSSIPEVPSVLPPVISKTKGSGAGGRRKSNAEKAKLLAQKPMHNCRKCNRKGHHDSRNCPGKDGVDV